MTDLVRPGYILSEDDNRRLALITFQQDNKARILKEANNDSQRKHENEVEIVKTALYACGGLLGLIVFYLLSSRCMTGINNAFDATGLFLVTNMYYLFSLIAGVIVVYFCTSTECTTLYDNVSLNNGPGMILCSVTAVLLLHLSGVSKNTNLCYGIIVLAGLGVQIFLVVFLAREVRIIRRYVVGVF